ncbi:hypothetical protein [Myceligenerans pegani]|uniref:Uncharacterized protein n=1 Tax=Myceligenerans pegani TaxID=2776917 RepID=A0ABR9N0X4_9MICO|nr:hypothetical protein [Myceligenerans sp. TRM 65318]MBE1877303.1 hypothetical protein [Myceligenerans sp. TRM 65318]MBE3019574.1 hypothetical protein [Myceligenerans sp. TRM 65318]
MNQTLHWAAEPETLAITQNGTALLAAEVNTLNAIEVLEAVTGTGAAPPPSAGPPTSRDLAEVVADADRSGDDPSPASAVSLALAACIGEYTAAGDRSAFPSFATTTWVAPTPMSFELVYQSSLVAAHASVWNPGPSPTLLWDVWRDVLDEAEARDHEPSDEELTRIEAARALLYVDADAGSVTDIYRRYAKLQGELIVAASRHAQLQLSETVSETELDASEAAVANAASRLAIEGRQSDVEAAIQTIATYGSSRPTKLFTRARENFDLVTIWRTDAASGARYPETSFVPASFETAAWTPIQLSRADIIKRSSVGDRYPELSEARLVDHGAIDAGERLLVDGLKAELAFVAVRRESWFNPDLLGLRAWRLKDPTAPLVSDGAVPAAGRLPAFAVGLVLIRNLELARVVENQMTFEEERRLRQEHYDREYPAAKARHEQLRLVDPRKAALEGIRVPPLLIPRYLPADPYRRPEVCIAAFVCQLVPRSPDPDPVLFADE